MVKKKTPFQSFRLDLEALASCLVLVAAGIDTRRALAEHLGMGQKKVEGFLEWAEFGNLIESRPRTVEQSLTHLGSSLLSLPKGLQNIRAKELLYFELVTTHPILDGLVNDFAFSLSMQFDPYFTRDRFARTFVAIGQELGGNPAFLRTRVSLYLDLLTNAAGLGGLGIFVKTGENGYRVNAYVPDWRTCAYLLYSSWPENTSRRSIGELLTSRGSLGRVFLLREGQALAVLSRLEQERAIALEVIADLRQVGLNPAMRATDFLEMLCHDGT